MTIRDERPRSIRCCLWFLPRSRWYIGCFISIVVFYKGHKADDCLRHGKQRPGGFTFVEAIVSLGVIAVGVASTLTALTRMNYVANTSRNATGAYTVAINQIDKILSAGPFIPQNKTDTGAADPEIPAVLTVGTTTTNNVPVYKDPDTGVVVPGTMETEIQDISNTTTGVYMYRATVKVAYQYRGRGPIWSGSPRNRWEYQFTMSTVRASDR